MGVKIFHSQNSNLCTTVFREERIRNDIAEGISREGCGYVVIAIEVEDEA